MRKQGEKVKALQAVNGVPHAAPADDAGLEWARRAAFGAGYFLPVIGGAAL
jgi:hypothetical protein